MQTVILAGTVGRDAELRHTQNGDAILNFSLAIDNGKDKQGNKRDATWWDCSVWGKRATALQSMITTGGKLTVTGRPSAREYGGKIYMQCSVDQLTFQGGGQKRDDYGHDPRTSEGYPAGDGGRPSDDLGDEIPFHMEWRV